MKLSLVILIFLIVVAMGRASMPNTLEQLPAKQATVVMLHGLTRFSKAMEKMATTLRAEGYTAYIRLHATHACMVWNKNVVGQTKYFLEHGCFNVDGAGSSVYIKGD